MLKGIVRGGQRGEGQVVIGIIASEDVVVAAAAAAIVTRGGHVLEGCYVIVLMIGIQKKGMIDLK